MERLTKLGRVMGEEKVCCTHFGCDECDVISGQCAEGCSWEERAWEKLYDYEETGLTPEEIRQAQSAMKRALSLACELQAYRNAQKDGRLFIAPAKVGDEVYFVYQDEVTGEYFVSSPERIVEVGTRGFFLAVSSLYPDDPDDFVPYEELGTEYYLSREEAEAERAKLQAAEGQPEEAQKDV